MSEEYKEKELVVGLSIYLSMDAGETEESALERLERELGEHFEYQIYESEVREI